MYLKSAKLCVFILGLLHSLAYALPSDKKQLMHVDADSADLNQKTHIGIYTGHIKFMQGTTHLHAESAITQGNDKNELIYAVAKGSVTEQAHYGTQPAIDKPAFHAYADTIRYYADSHLIDLDGNAKIIQGKNSFSAPFIQYNTLKQALISKSKGADRTTIIFYPEKKKL